MVFTTAVIVVNGQIIFMLESIKSIYYMNLIANVPVQIKVIEITI